MDGSPIPRPPRRHHPRLTPTSMSERAARPVRPGALYRADEVRAAHAARPGKGARTDLRT